MAPSIKEALEYERRIRTKIYDSNILTAGEWVYLVGVFQAANEHEECPANAALSPPAGDSREAIARQIDPVAFDNIGLLAKGRQRVAFEATDRLFASGLVQDEAAIEPVLSFLDELAANAAPGKRQALNPIVIGGSAKLYAEGLRAAIRSARGRDEG